ncbi:TerB family tellurite resistance protein [Janthinobacterium sp.]|uniref:tellurite resistance TerB family protein n=1 Tax=Janthinobacterium sp. TaxID=1871054 RepID=UPI00293D380F|nr:TerB family tellurite resistance protein [Janthinobacterium sp.]
MRHYPTNSPQAAGRILALSMLVDGHLAPVELEALENSQLLELLDIDKAMFQDLLQELCYDMLNTTGVQGAAGFDRALIDSLLDEIKEPELRRKLLRAMWSITDADGWLADAEAELLARACVLWAAESSFIDRAGATPA